MNYVNDWKISWGGNIQYSDYFNNTSDLYNQAEYITKFNFYKYGLFGNISKSFFENKLDVSIGIRSDEDTFSNGSKLTNNLSPRLSTSLSISKDRRLKWNSSLGSYYKIPVYTVLGFKTSLGEFANRDAQYTKSNHFVTGFDYALGNASKISVEGFLKKYDQFPISVVDGVSLANKGADFEVLGNENIITDGKGKTRGLEFLFQQKLTNNFYGIFSYTFFKSEFTDINGNYLPSVWDSKHLSSFSGGYKLKKNWEISSRWRFSGKTPYVPYDLDASLANYPNMILDYSELGNVKLGNFSQVDIRFDKKWNKENISINFFIEILNLLAQKIPSPSEYGLERDIRVNINRDTGDIKLESYLKIVDKYSEEEQSREILLSEALKFNKNAKIDEYIIKELPPLELGRVAAQNAKGVIIQKVREADKLKQYEEYKDKVGEIAVGIIKRVEFGNYIVDLGKSEAIIKREELIPRETFKNGDRVRAYIYDVKNDLKRWMPLVKWILVIPHIIILIFLFISINR